MKIFAEVFKAVMQAHLPALQQCEPRQKFVHAVATHEPLPLDDVEDPLLDVLPLEELGATHAPLVHVPPVLLQLSQVAPPVPHAPLSVPSWHVPELSQHPVAQLVESHVVPPLLLVLVPLELVDPPPSSPLLLVLDDVVLPDELL